MVEAVLGTEIQIPEKKQQAATPSSSTHSSPELRASDILKQRQERNGQEAPKEAETVQEEEAPKQVDAAQSRHAELDSIGSVLEGLSEELNQILAGAIENKKQILMTEENLTKTMLRLDSVQSDGDASIRKHRKQLIKKSQDLLDLVDEFKQRETKAAAPATTADAAETTTTTTTTTTEDIVVEDQVAAAAAKPASALATVEEEEEEAEDDDHVDTLSVSDMESLPDIFAEDSTKDHEQENNTVDEEPSAESVSEPAAQEHDDDTVPTTKAMETEVEAEAEPELSHSHDSESSSDEEEQVEEPALAASEESQKSDKPVAHPLDLIVEAALKLARDTDSLDHDFEMVFA
ncbi:hypothetical protein B0O80DRAFT_454363 [Mortierella sp. GBAus27b]|nr:hypothetical protein B0O80DRAFT_454363 [Mortierella sp. GBAus27b]